MKGSLFLVLLFSFATLHAGARLLFRRQALALRGDPEKTRIVVGLEVARLLTTIPQDTFQCEKLAVLIRGDDRGGDGKEDEDIGLFAKLLIGVYKWPAKCILFRPTPGTMVCTTTDVVCLPIREGFSLPHYWAIMTLVADSSKFVNLRKLLLYIGGHGGKATVSLENSGTYLAPGRNVAKDVMDQSLTNVVTAHSTNEKKMMIAVFVHACYSSTMFGPIGSTHYDLNKAPPKKKVQQVVGTTTTTRKMNTLCCCCTSNTDGEWAAISWNYKSTNKGIDCEKELSQHCEGKVIEITTRSESCSPATSECIKRFQAKKIKKSVDLPEFEVAIHNPDAWKQVNYFGVSSASEDVCTGEFMSHMWGVVDVAQNNGGLDKLTFAAWVDGSMSSVHRFDDGTGKRVMYTDQMTNRLLVNKKDRPMQYPSFGNMPYQPIGVFFGDQPLTSQDLINQIVEKKDQDHKKIKSGSKTVDAPEGPQDKRKPILERRNSVSGGDKLIPGRALDGRKIDKIKKQKQKN